MAKGPCGPRGEGKQINILPAGKYLRPKVTLSRNQGTGEKVTVSARCAKALIGAVPRRSLVLSIAGKNTLLSPKTKGTAHGPSLWFYSTVFKDSTISSFFSFRWAARFTTRENTVVSSTAHR